MVVWLKGAMFFLDSVAILESFDSHSAIRLKHSSISMTRLWFKMFTHTILISVGQIQRTACIWTHVRPPLVWWELHALMPCFHSLLSCALLFWDSREWFLINHALAHSFSPAPSCSPLALYHSLFLVSSSCVLSCYIYSRPPGGFRKREERWALQPQLRQGVLLLL